MLIFRLGQSRASADNKLKFPRLSYFINRLLLGIGWQNINSMNIKLTKGCHYFKYGNEGIELCLHLGEGWEDSFLALKLDSNIYIFKGERDYECDNIPIRSIIANLMTSSCLPEPELKEINYQEISPILKDSIKRYNICNK